MSMHQPVALPEEHEHRPVTLVKGHRVRNAAVVAGMSGALVTGVAGIAQAAQPATLDSNQSHSYSTWFFGRTKVCFTNDDPTYDAAYTWSSGPSSGGGGLVPEADAGERSGVPQSCTTLSFVGLPITVHNVSPRASIDVTFPIGP